MAVLDDVKKSLRVTGTDDDDEINRLITSNVRECLKFLDGVTLDNEIVSSEQVVYLTDDLFNGVIIMIKADYEGDLTKRHEYRSAAESLWFPYRESVGL
jgi:hypothetical protein